MANLQQRRVTRVERDGKTYRKVERHDRNRWVTVSFVEVAVDQRATQDSPEKTDSGYVTLKMLPEVLAGISDVEEVERMKEADTRKNAPAVYDARIAELLEAE